MKGLGFLAGIALFSQSVLRSTHHQRVFTYSTTDAGKHMSTLTRKSSDLAIPLRRTGPRQETGPGRRWHWSVLEQGEAESEPS